MANQRHLIVKSNESSLSDERRFAAIGYVTIILHIEMMSLEFRYHVYNRDQSRKCEEMKRNLIKKNRRIDSET